MHAQPISLTNKGRLVSALITRISMIYKLFIGYEKLPTAHSFLLHYINNKGSVPKQERIK